MSSERELDREVSSIYLHQAPLHVVGFRSLDSRVDQTFSTRNRVEQKLGRCQFRIEAVAHETFGWRILRLLGKVRQRSILETIGDSLAGYHLLAHASNHLRDIDGGTYRVVISVLAIVRVYHGPLEPAVAMMRGAL